MSTVLHLARPEIVALQAYEHALWDTRFERLHANELPWRGVADSSVAGLNRYPEPHPRELEKQLAALYEVPVECVVAGRGSDEAIDLLVRVFCRAGQDRVVICPPTFGMYGVAARIQGAAVTAVPLLRDRGFALDEARLLSACDAQTKIVFLCSPNNPTGNSLGHDAVARIVTALAGRAVVVIDEAYIEFSARQSFVNAVAAQPHVAVLRTFSKAHGLAGARLGALIAHPDIVALARRVIPPYAVTQLTIEAAGHALAPTALAVTRERIAAVLAERARLAAALAELRGIRKVWPSDANFLLVDFDDPRDALERTRGADLLIRDVRGNTGLECSLRITVGSPDQNDRLIESFR